ncbi:hypothetical protein [Algibacter aquimarinus]|uniref:DUF1795 domain-containing protein n=1 Tax=Algibacter aquimarinus TaxID=1136748 RepID=A0ABP9HP01_9FLAO
MKLTYLLLFFVTINTYSQEDYIVKINDTELEIALDSTYTLEIDNKSLNITFKSKDILVYDDSLFNFQYPSDFKVSKTIIDEGVEQIMLMTAEGSGILIQKYEGFNPTFLNEMMINEITKESINYGFKLERKDYERKLKSEQTLNIDKAILTYKDETNIYEVATIGKKDEGILIMTMIMDTSINNEQGNKLIELMWNSLNYK